MSIDKKFSVEFEPIVAHDIFATIHEISARLHCNWLVKEWGGHHRGAITIHNQMGWLEEHLACNVATFRDVGIRYFRKILVHIDLGHNNSVILMTCAKLAQVNNAELVFVKWLPNEYSEKRVSSEKAFLLEAAQIYAPQSSCKIIKGKNEIVDISSMTSESFDS